MWTKKELQTQDPAENSSVRPAPQTRFVPTEKIEVVRALF